MTQMHFFYDEGSSSPVLCDNLEGWHGVGGGRVVPEENDTCIPLADHIDV